MRVLLVEDSMARSMEMADGLEREGVEVSLALTESEAGHRVKASCPDVLLLDSARIGKSTRDFLRETRVSCPHLRLVLLGVRAADRHKFAELAPDAVFETFAPQAIVTVLRRLIAA